MLFKDLNIHPAILQAIEERKYEIATPIQAQAIPAVLSGKDLLGCAQTGTGKTAAFAIPILQKIYKSKYETEMFPKIRALILAPTRELAIQIEESFQKYGKHLPIQTGVIYGGVTPKRHVKVLQRGIDILVATPGRLLDLMDQGYVDLKNIEMFVLDEADRMLDLGMIKDVERIISKLPKVRQNMLFSATIPKEISKLIHAILKNPIRIEVQVTQANKLDITQQVYFVDDPDKVPLLRHLLTDPALESVLVFVRTKGKADKVCKALNVNNVRSRSIHGDKNQSERIKALDSFKKKEIRVLVATDVAARGIDIDKLSHVVNLDIPNISETYIHRIGRTGRAGMTGVAISFCSNKEIPYLKDIEKLQGKTIKVIDRHPYVLVNVAIDRNREKYAEPQVANKPIAKSNNKSPIASKKSGNQAGNPVKKGNDRANTPPTKKRSDLATKPNTAKKKIFQKPNAVVKRDVKK